MTGARRFIPDVISGTLVPAPGGEVAPASTKGSGASGVVSAVAARFLVYTHVPRAILDPDAASG